MSAMAIPVTTTHERRGCDLRKPQHQIRRRHRIRRRQVTVGIEGRNFLGVARTRRGMTNRVVEGRMVTSETLAELIEGERPMEATEIEDADRECPECGGNVISVGYMPSVTAFVTGFKCQDCEWSDKDE